MSFLGNVVSSVAKAVTDPGALVKDAVNTLLPKTLSVVGDIAGAVVDFQRGRPLESLLHGAEALRDLPQALQGFSSGTSGSTAGAGSAAFQPAPPTPRGAVTVTTSSPWRSTPPPSPASPAASASHPASGATAQPAFANSALVGRALGSDALERSVQSLVSALLRSLGGQSALAHPASAPAASPGGSSAASSAKPTAGTSPTTPASVAGDPASKQAATPSSTPSNKQTSAAPGATTAAPKSLSELLALGDSDFMKAMTSGSLPADVKNDPTAMVQIQARMNQISQMTELLSTMMKAMHDMQMAVVQNVRV